MIEIKLYDDRWTKEFYIEDNYEYLYATLRGLGDIAIERFPDVEYDEDTIEEEFLKDAMAQVSYRLDICDDEVTKKIFKYFYYTVPVIVNNDYIYRQKKDNLNELRKLAGMKIRRPRQRKISRF